MVGRTLGDLRERVDALASSDGPFYLRCARTGDRPVPAAGRRFAARADARRAARVVERYRATLRRYDPHVPYYDVIVCQGVASDPPDGPSDRTFGATLSTPVLDAATPRSSNRTLVEFCHRVAAAVFESLSAAGHDAVEAATMDAYADLADGVADPDRLCLHLLERLATDVAAGLTADEQAALLDAAATRLGPHRSGAAKPVSATLGHLEDHGVLGEHLRSPWSIDLDDGRRAVDVRLSGYALSPRDGRLPVLPLAVDLYRRRPDWPLSSIRVVDLGDAWRLSFVFRQLSDPDGLATAPIDEV